MRIRTGNSVSQDILDEMKIKTWVAFLLYDYSLSDPRPRKLTNSQLLEPASVFQFIGNGTIQDPNTGGDVSHEMAGKIVDATPRKSGSWARFLVRVPI
jgi:hypothetical protein